jgi:hypothetical protein
MHREFMCRPKHSNRDFLQVVIVSDTTHEDVDSQTANQPAQQYIIRKHELRKTLYVQNGETYTAIGDKYLGEWTMVARDTASDRLDRVDRSAGKTDAGCTRWRCLSHFCSRFGDGEVLEGGSEVV